MSQTPSISRIVHYKLTAADCAQVTDRLAFAQTHLTTPTFANAVQPGDVYPAMIVRTWGDTAASSVQLQVFIDGNFTIWATSVCVAEHSPGHSKSDPHPERSYIWPPRV